MDDEKQKIPELPPNGQPADRPEEVEELLKQAQEALDFGQNDKAVDLYQEAISTVAQPEADLFNKLGIAYARAGELESAEMAFQDAIDTDKTFAPALSNMGNIYFSRKEYDEAQEYYEQAIRYDPDYSTAYNNLAALYKKQGKIGESVKAMKKSQRLAMTNTRSTYAAHDDEGTRKRGVLGCFGSSMLLLITVGLLLTLLLVVI